MGGNEAVVTAKEWEGRGRGGNYAGKGHVPT